MEKFNSDEEKIEYLLDTLSYYNETQPEAIAKVLQKKSGIKTQKFNELYDLFLDMHENEKNYEGVKTKTKGDVLESLIKFLTIETKIFDLFSNVSNQSNEYDIIIKPGDYAKSSYNALPEVIFQPIICECKNYKTTVDVTWVGKFYMLLSMANIKIGIIFSYEGITGESDRMWEDAKGLVKKIFLKDNIAIIDISKKELELIKNGKTLYDVIEMKYNELVFMTDIEKEKITHMSSGKVDEIIDKVKSEVEYCKLKKYKNVAPN